MSNIKTLHIIEPALNEPVGHLFSFFESICKVADDVEIHVYADKRFSYKPSRDGIHIHPHFIRKIRKWQVPFLVRKLVKSNSKILFATAETTDLISLKLFAGKIIQKNSVFLFFHLINTKKRKHNLTNRKARKENFYSEVAQAQPNIVLITPTESPMNFLRERGFKYVFNLPYPVNPGDYRPQKSKKFSHLLLSGDPRADKGIFEISEFIEYCFDNNFRTPLLLQTREDISCYPENLQAPLGKLLNSKYEFVKTLPSALSYEEYRNLYDGAISLQIYDKVLFSDRASGVALDALLHGTPSITLSDTWNAKLVNRFNSGVVIDIPTPEAIHSAVTKIIENYESYSNNAAIGGKTICQEHSMNNLIKIIFD